MVVRRRHGSHALLRFRGGRVHFHRTCRDALAPFGADLHPQYKQWCDEYFYLKHRQEPRGIGGIFFDDLTTAISSRCFALTRSVGDIFSTPTCRSSSGASDMPYGERERDLQAYRRGRYVEFNLVWDRGTLFGLQSGGRTESILMSLPPRREVALRLEARSRARPRRGFTVIFWGRGIGSMSEEKAMRT